MTTTSPMATAERTDASTARSLDIRHLPPGALTAVGRQARTHSRQQIKKIIDSIRAFGFSVPVIVDEQDKVIAGNARVEAAIQLGLDTIPVVTLSHLDAAQKRAFVLAENKLASEAGWDKKVLGLEFSELLEIDLDFSIELTGFLEPEIDAIIFGAGDDSEKRQNDVPEPPAKPVSRVGDLWLLGRHRLLCGDSTLADTVNRLMDGAQARTVFTDPPFNVAISGHVTGSGLHDEFVMASGEMSDAEFTTFLTDTLWRTRESLVPGGLAYVCMDFRHMRHLLDAADAVDLRFVNLIVWDKGSGGMGSFLRSRHELIFLFAVKGEPHCNRVQLGRHGRDRHNVWQYEGVNGFGKEKARAREMHPTVKPLAMVRDAILDCTARGDLVLDLFSGSGTTLIAAEDSGRRAAVMDLDPRHVDTTLLRWQQFTGKEARLAGSDLTWREVRAARTAEVPGMVAPAAPTVGAAIVPPPARVRTRRAA